MKHFIQKDVINTLSQVDSANYSDIKPPQMDGNQFTYHLKQLIADKLVAKNPNGTYSLTQTGRAYLVHRYEDQSKSAHSIFLIVLRYNDQIMLRTRKVQPQLGYTGLLHGEPITTSTTEQAIADRTLHKTGLTVNRIKIHGSGLIKIHVAGELQSFSHAIVAETWVDSLAGFQPEDETGTNLWTTENSLQQTDKLIPSTADILHRINSGQSGWFDLSYDL